MSGGAFSLTRTEDYTYDGETDWLTGVDYNDGLSNEVTTWGYDAAGNRTSDSAHSGSFAYDNLNRMTASPFGSYTNDVLGERVLLDVPNSGEDPGYQWDIVGRMVCFWPNPSYSHGQEYAYQYLADGMRVKSSDNWNSPTSTVKYYYDGQMPVQDTKAVSGGSTTVTKYGVGPRGVDLITKKVDSGSESFAFPMYDVHGNMVATLARSGSSSYTTGNAQSFDVWGSVRSGSSTVDQKYCANLGHRSDSESGLQYMRARYYDPSTGRFISEDPMADGANWFALARNKPSSAVDQGGTMTIPEAAALYRMCMLGYSLVVLYLTVSYATNSLSIEGAYGKFMSWHSWNFWSDVVGLPEDIVDYVGILSTVASAYATVAKRVIKAIAKSFICAMMFGGEVSPIGAIIGFAIGSLEAAVDILGPDNAMMFAAYYMRLGWYVADAQ